MSRPPAPRGGGGGGRGQTSLWKRLSGQTAQAYGHPLRGPPSAGPPGRSGVTFIPVATIVEEPQPPPGAPGAPGGGERAEAGRPRRSRSDAASAASDAPAVWALLATHTLVCCLGVAQFLVSALGLDRSPRAVAFWALLLLRARRLRAAWEAQMEATRGLTLRLSSACLGTLAAASTRVREEEERVAALLRRALSFEHKLNVGEAIRCYEARPGLSPSPPPRPLFNAPPPQAASKLVPDDPEPLVGLAKCLSDRGAGRGVAGQATRARSPHPFAPPLPFLCAWLAQCLSGRWLPTSGARAH